MPPPVYYSALPTQQVSDYEPAVVDRSLERNEWRKRAANERNDMWICKLYNRWKQGQFTIVPDGNNLFIDIWDVIMIAALMITAVVLPLQVGLMHHPPQLVNALMSLIDLVFITDIFLTFNIAFGKVSVTNRDMYELHPLKIAKQYTAFPFSDGCTAGWFWPDLLTVVPWDKIFEARYGASLRLIRILRLIRMFRLVRVIKLFSKWQAHFGHPIAIVQISQCLGCTLLTCHWVACTWGHFAVGEGYTNDNWLIHYQEMYGYAERLSDYTEMDIYYISLYWSLSTLTSVGYGDVLPQNTHEVVLVSVSMFMLGIMWAWVLANVVNIITNMDVFASESNQLMDDLNQLMEHRDLDHGLRLRLRKHLNEAFYVHRQRHQQRTIKWLSAGLQGEIAVESGVDKVCNCVWYLRDMPEPVLIAIANRFIADMFSPYEFIQDQFSLSVIRKGTCILRARILTRDHVIGEDMILVSDRLKEAVHPKSLTFLEVMTLGRNDLLSVCERHPDFDRRVRRAQIKLALWRSFVRSAESKARGLRPCYTQILEEKEDNMRTPGFSQSIQTIRGFKGLSVQDSLNEIMEELQALRRRVDDNQLVCLTHFEGLATRIDGMSYKDGVLAKGQKSCTKLSSFCRA